MAVYDDYLRRNDLELQLSIHFCLLGKDWNGKENSLKMFVSRSKDDMRWLITPCFCASPKLLHSSSLQLLLVLGRSLTIPTLLEKVWWSGLEAKTFHSSTLMTSFMCCVGSVFWDPCLSECSHGQTALPYQPERRPSHASSEAHEDSSPHLFSNHCTCNGRRRHTTALHPPTPTPLNYGCCNWSRGLTLKADLLRPYQKIPIGNGRVFCSLSCSEDRELWRIGWAFFGCTNWKPILHSVANIMDFINNKVTTVPPFCLILYVLNAK